MEKREGEAMLTDLKLFCRQMDTKAELQRKPETKFVVGFKDLGHSDWLEAGLTSIGEVTCHFNIVRGAAQVRIYPISAFNTEKIKIT